MSDIFISYAREDRSRVVPLVQLLEERGWSVWWDREILPGSQFESIIDGAIRNARCVIVVWTENSVDSDWVNAEAGDGLERGILVPVMLESVRLPLVFRRWQAARLLNWPEQNHPQELTLLMEAVENVLRGIKPVHTPPGQKRPATGAPITRRVAMAAAAISLIAAVFWLAPRFLAPPSAASAFKQIVVADLVGEDRTYFAQSFVREVVGALKRYPDLLTATGSDLGSGYSGFILKSRIEDNRLRLLLTDPDGASLLDELYKLDANALQTLARDATRDIVNAVGETYIEPVNAILGGEDLQRYLEATNVLRSSESFTILDTASRDFQEILERNPRHTPALIGLCRVNLRMFIERSTPIFFENAERFCHRAMTLDRNNADAQLALGELYSSSGMHNEAITALSEVVSRTPYNLDAIRALGNAYLRAGATDLAEKQFLTAVQLEPGYWGNHKNLGDIMLNRGRYAEAVTHYWRAVNLAQNKSGPLGDVAAALFLSGEFADAVDVWLQTLELEPLPVTYSNLGSAYYFLRQYNEAAKMYEHAIELAPDDHLWWGHAGEAYLQLDTGTPQHYFERASELASAAREINPNDPLLASRLATYRAALGDMELARQLIGQARELGALDLDLLYDEAVVWSRLGETENARRTIAVLLDKGYSQELIDLDGNFSFSTHQGERQ